MNLFKEASELIRNPHSRSLFCDYAEIAIDSISDSKTVDTIPVVGTLTKGGQFLLSVKDKLFLRRLKSFLDEIDTIAQSKVDDFLDKLEKEGQTEHFGEHLLTIIEKTESPHKASIIGILFKRLLNKTVSRDNFDHLSYAATRTYIHDLYQLYYATINPNILDESLGMSLSSSRLVDAVVKLKSNDTLTINMLKNADFAQSEMVYKINARGRILAEVIKEYIDQKNSSSNKG
jgi:hypothetical protein